MTPTIEHLEGRRLFSVLFDDEFNGASLDSSKWSNTANWGDDHPQNELETYTRAGNLTVANGAATITAKNTGGNWTSFEMQSGGTYAAGGSVKPEFSYLYGYTQMRVKLPSGIGAWPAGWSMPTPAAPGALHDGDGEIDGFEAEGDAPNNVQAHLHHNNTYGATYRGSVDLSAGYHLIGWDWQAGKLTWDVDGTVYAQTTSNVPNVPEFLIVNLAISDGIFGAPPNGTTPSTLNYSIDWIHVTSTKAEAFTGSPTPPPTIAGDANHDGKVDGVDLLALATNYGKKATWEQGDFSGDGRCDVTDLGLLATNYGFGTGGLVTSATFNQDFADDLASLTKHKHRVNYGG